MARGALDRHAVLVERETLRAERHALVEADARAEDCSLADDDAGAVVDEEALADLRARVDVDARARVRELRDDAGEQRDAELIERVREPVVRDRRDARVAEEDFVDASRGGVAVVGCANVGLEQASDVGQAKREVAHELARAALEIPRGNALCARPIGELAPHLLEQLGESRVERVADEVVDALLGQIWRAVVLWKERSAQPPHDADERVAGRKALAARVPRVMVPLRARDAQRADEVVEVPRTPRRGRLRARRAHLRQMASPSAPNTPSNRIVLR